VEKKRGVRESRVYILIAVFVIVAVIIVITFGTGNFTPAYIPDNFLGDDWSENLLERESGSDLLGFEKWSSLTYEIDGLHPASLTIYTIKSLVMLNENELIDRTKNSIQDASEQGIEVVNSTEINGVRALKNKHKTTYILYDGNDTSKNPVEKIKIIGEVWNCGVSGTSVICIGIVQVTDNSHGDSNVNTTHWEKIVSDGPGMINGYADYDGLIYNVACH